MSKGLEALKYLKENKRRHWLENDKSNECLDIIEKELKRLEELEEEKQSFDRVIEKKLKALKIIKEKLVDVVLFITVADENWDSSLGNKEQRLKKYNELNDDIDLTQEEFDLLKEVLL